MTPPNWAVLAAFKLMETLGPDPPPERPVPTVILFTVPLPGGNAERTPFESIVRLEPTLIPPSVEFVAGTRLMVPATVIVPPERPVPAVTLVTVPPAVEELTIIPVGVTESPLPRIRGPDPESTLYEGSE